MPRARGIDLFVGDFFCFLFLFFFFFPPLGELGSGSPTNYAGISGLGQGKYIFKTHRYMEHLS